MRDLSCTEYLTHSARVAFIRLWPPIKLPIARKAAMFHKISCVSRA
jgi:hypothetical protein